MRIPLPIKMILVYLEYIKNPLLSNPSRRRVNCVNSYRSVDIVVKIMDKLRATMYI